MVDCLDMAAAQKAGQEELLARVCMKGDREDRVSGEPQAPWLLWVSGRGGAVPIKASDGIF